MTDKDVKCPCGYREYMEEHNCKNTNCEKCCPLSLQETITRQQAELEKCIRKSTVHEKTVELVTAQLKTANEVIDKIEAENNSLRAKVKELQALLYMFLDTRNGNLVRITNTELENIKRPIKVEAIKEFIEKCVMEFGCGRGDDRAECYISDADFLEVMERMYVGGDGM